MSDSHSAFKNGVFFSAHNIEKIKAPLSLRSQRFCSRSLMFSSSFSAVNATQGSSSEMHKDPVKSTLKLRINNYRLWLVQFIQFLLTEERLQSVFIKYLSFNATGHWFCMFNGHESAYLINASCQTGRLVQWRDSLYVCVTDIKCKQ